MRVWGYGNFENDDAYDWALELAERESLSPITLALEQGVDYLEDWECNQLLAAAETVAALAGRPADCIPEELRTWVNRRIGMVIDVELARDAVSALLEKSELRNVWSVKPEYPKWLDTQEDLLRRL